MLICKYCGSKRKTTASVIQHEIRCAKNPDRKIYVVERHETLCRYCNRVTDTKHGNSFHEKHCLLNPNKDISDNNKVSCLQCKRVILGKQLTNHYKSKSCVKFKDHPPKNKIKNTETCTYCGKMPRLTMAEHLSICRGIKRNRPQIWTQERRLSHSDAMKKAVMSNPDSYTKNNVCGRVKIIEYNGANLKGTWEVETAIWLDSLNVQWENEVNPQPYFWNNREHLYFPDFYLPTHNVYIEVKGYKTERDEAKWSQFNGILVVIDKTNIKNLNELSLDECITRHSYKGTFAQRPSALDS
jgi:hypothetical protein